MMKKPKYKVERTTEGTVFELGFLLLSIIVWSHILIMYRDAPDLLPTHFGPSGMPDAFGSKTKMLVTCIMMTVIGICLLFGAYFPHNINLPGIHTVNNRQAALCARMVRILGILFLGMSAAIAIDTLRGHILFVFVMLVVMITCTVAFTLLIYKNK